MPTQHHPITTKTFSSYAFPVVKVRYAGPTDHRGSRWIAKMRYDNEHTYRSSLPYRSELPSGAVNALAAALACLEQALVDSGEPGATGDYVAIPGDLDADTYSFTFVPASMFD